MNKKLTEIIFVLDRSGSMSWLTNETIGGFNSFIERQKKESGDALLTTVLFDNEYEVLHDRINIKDIKPLDDKQYYARGSTALLDAIGKTISVVGNKMSLMEEKDKPSNVLFVITTDGYENSSKEFTEKTIREMVDEKKNKNNWNFIFFGANIDAIKVAGTFNIQMATTYSSSINGTRSVYDTINATATSLRSTGSISSDWDKGIE